MLLEQRPPPECPSVAILVIQTFCKKKLFDAQQIERALADSIQILFELNPKAQIICSVSPLRHDPLPPEDNSLSKAQLLCAVHRLRRKAAAAPSGPLANWSYFPAYEIVIDELRDYRWYDGKQLRIEALDLLLERLLAAVAGKELKQFLHQTAKLARLLRHKPHRKGSSRNTGFGSIGLTNPIGPTLPARNAIAQILAAKICSKGSKRSTRKQSCPRILRATAA